MTNSQTYLGNIVRLLSHGSFGGAIFSFEVNRSPRRIGGSVIVVVADAPLFVERPLVGEPWKVEGYWFDSPSYGRQFKATAATHWKPSGPAVVDFLGKSGVFGTLTVRDARRLWKEFGSSLVTALDEGDISTLAGAGMRLEKCKSLVYSWLHYWSIAKLKDLLLRRSVHPRVVERIHGILGASAYRLISENPYRLAPFLNWRELDSLPAEIGIDLPQEVRGRSACIHLLLDMQRRGRVSNRYSYVVDRLSLRLGSASAATTALERAISNKMAFVVRQDGAQYVHAAGAELIQRALCTSLLLRQMANVAPGLRKPSIEVINAPLLDVESVVNLLAQAERGLTHILGVSDAETNGVIEAMAHRVISPNSILHDGYPHLPWTDADVVVHDADQLSFVTLSKLLRRLQSASRIRILGRAHGYPAQTDGPSVFTDIAFSGVLPLTSLMSDTQAEVIVGKPNFKLAKSYIPTSICRFRPTPIYWLSTSTSKELSSTAAAFRECAHYGSAVLFTAHAAEVLPFAVKEPGVFGVMAPAKGA